MQRCIAMNPCPVRLCVAGFATELTGEIPLAFSTLNYLQILNLGYNKVRGRTDGRLQVPLSEQGPLRRRFLCHVGVLSGGEGVGAATGAAMPRSACGSPSAPSAPPYYTLQPVVVVGIGKVVARQGSGWRGVARVLACVRVVEPVPMMRPGGCRLPGQLTPWTSQPCQCS